MTSGKMIRDTRDAMTSSSSREQALVRVTDAGYTYPSGTAALSGVTLEVRPHEVLGIVGPSGCGKSTLLRIIAGLVEPTSGTIRGSRENSDAQLDMAMVFQADTVMPWITVEKNAGMYSQFQPLSVRRRTASARRARIRELLQMVGLEHCARSYPYQLSGGERRRLAFVTAVAASPRILLLDEPFASVDEPTRVQIHQDVLEVIHKLRMTVVLVTHDLAEAATLCDRVLVMTRRPGSVCKEHTISFGPDRDVVALRQTSGFLAEYGELWHDLSAQTGRADAP
jgi:ABC-type nitrate/sulfonate/bicarbonate transport system ATPase subunit